MSLGTGEHGHSLLIGGTDVGDTITLPRELGGTVHKVIEDAVGPCHKKHDAIYRLLEGTDVYVIECPTCKQYLWCRLPQEAASEERRSDP